MRLLAKILHAIADAIEDHLGVKETIGSVWSEPSQVLIGSGGTGTPPPDWGNTWSYYFEDGEWRKRPLTLSDPTPTGGLDTWEF